MSVGHNAGCPESKEGRAKDKAKTYSPGVITVNGKVVGAVKEISYHPHFPDIDIGIYGRTISSNSASYQPAPPDMDFEWLPPPDVSGRRAAIFDEWYGRAIAELYKSCMVNLPELKGASKVYVMPSPIRILDYTV